MPTAANLSLRVNGVECKDIRLQHELIDGNPFGPTQVVIKDAPIGTFSLTDDCLIELKEEGRDWQRVTLSRLIALLTTYQD